MSNIRPNPYRRETSNPPVSAHSRSNPRHIKIERKDNGFGFTLRHFIVYPSEDGSDGGPPIQEPMDTIFVKSVKYQGPAVDAGLNIGDRIVSVNGESVAGRSYAQVVQMIQKSRDSLFLVVVPKQDDILQVYFSDIAQNPESNKRTDPSKPPWPASVCSSSSRESSPFSSKTSDSTKDSVYGHNTVSAPSSNPAPAYSGGWRNRPDPELREIYANREATRAKLADPEHIYDTIQSARRNERLSQYLPVPPSSHSASSEQLYSAIPALASSSRSSSSTLLSGGQDRHRSRDSLDSSDTQDTGGGWRNRLKRDCERKEEFLRNQTKPAYLSSPPKDIDQNPRGIANLASTMPPPAEKPPEPPVAKNFFMDIYAQEMSKMAATAKEQQQVPKKKHFDASQFNAYGLPLGYRKGGYFENVDAFSRNNYVIVGSRTLHCEPPQVYQPTPEPLPKSTVCSECYGGFDYPSYHNHHHHHLHHPHHHPGYHPPHPPLYPPYCPGCAASMSPCPACSMLTMSQPQSRPRTLPGIQSLGVGPRDSPAHLVYMHPDPDSLGHLVGHQHHTVVDLEPHPHSGTYSSWDRTSSASGHITRPSPSPSPNNISFRRKNFQSEDEEEKNLRRISYLQATKEERMEVEENLTNESGLAPTHSIKKLKSLFNEKNPEPTPQAASTPKTQDPPPVKSEQSISPPVEEEKENIKEGWLTCKVAVLDGRKANDRSWKTVYTILKKKVLYMYKDKKMAMENLEYEEKPVKLAESDVEIANDYTKRKNVFRVKTDGGSEYLFQADNESEMKNWVTAIDHQIIIVDERKDLNKLKKLTSFRNRSPTGQSPASKSRKPSAETIPPYKDKDKKTWKGKIKDKVKSFGGGSHGPHYPEGGSISVPLEECPVCPVCAVPSPSCSICVDSVPYLVKLCCDIVTEKGLEIVGIYRVPGNNAAVTYLTEQINKGVDSFALEDQRWHDVNVVSSLLKSFFRKLPNPLFTADMYSLFIEASKIDQATRRMDQLRKLVRELPEFHFETLKYVTHHLCQVADNSSTNKMEVRNLAIVFGPTLVRTSDDNMVSMVTDMSQQCRIIESILSNWEYFFTEEEVEVKEDDKDDSHNLGTDTSNQSQMLENLKKLEDAGKVGSPKGDVSAKDIVSSIISAANRKMLKKATGKEKKESSVECESERGSSVTRDSRDFGARRESESVIHGALQIASAVPGIVAGMDTTSDTESGERPSYSRQNSRGSLSLQGRRGSSIGLPPVTCPSKRGSMCEYTGGQVCESCPVGELCETRITMMKNDSETVTNGHGESEQVVTGKLSLVNVPGYPRVSPDTSVTVSTSSANTLSVSAGTLRPDSAPPPQTTDFKFPIESYAGLEKANAERVAKFEAETKAMLTQRSGLAKSSQDIREVVTTSHHRHAEDESTRSTPVSSTISSNTSLVTGSISSLLSHSQDQEANDSSQSLSRTLSSLTTPVPDSNPLDGGILVEEPYNTEAYDLPTQRRFVDLTYRASLPNLQPVNENLEVDQHFDTKKVATRGTLQRMKVKIRPELHSSLGLETGSDNDLDQADSERLLNTLTESFDMKMRLLLDPHYQSGSSSDPQCPVTAAATRMFVDSINLEDVNNGAFSGINKKKIDEAKNVLQQVKAAKKVELKRGGRVDKNLERKVRGPEFGVLKQVNTKRQLDRSNSLSKQEKTELNLKAQEKENSVSALKDQFERLGQNENIEPQQQRPIKSDITKLRKKLSECKNKRIQRRHTVGGTKDFSENVVSLLVRGVSVWDRLAPIISDDNKMTDNDDERRLSLQFEEERRLSLPTVESSV